VVGDRHAEHQRRDAAPIGPHATPTLAPWMRELVRRYFVDRRRTNES
jgi:hypothetical protein